MEKTIERERERVRETDRGTGSQAYRRKENKRGMKDSATERRRQGKAKTGRDLGGVGDAERAGRNRDEEEGGRMPKGLGLTAAPAFGTIWRNIQFRHFSLSISLSPPFLFCTSGYSTVIHLREYRQCLTAL